MPRVIVIFAGSVKTYHRRCHLEIKGKKKRRRETQVTQFFSWNFYTDVTTGRKLANGRDVPLIIRKISCANVIEAVFNTTTVAIDWCRVSHTRSHRELLLADKNALTLRDNRDRGIKRVGGRWNFTLVIHATLPEWYYSVTVDGMILKLRWMVDKRTVFP